MALFMEAFLFDNEEAKEKADCISNLSIAVVNACHDLDVNEFVSVIAVMLDQFQANHDLDNATIENVLDGLVQIRKAVSEISKIGIIAKVRYT